jgi:cell division protein ZapA
MSDDSSRVTVRILDKDYQIACPQEERAQLLDAAEYLTTQMREIRDGGRVVGLDRVAVMAALNLAHELLQERGRAEGLDQDVQTKLQNLRERVEVALSDSRQLEI